MKYVISKEATKDLEKIWLYTFETWSLAKADRYFNLILEEIEHLAIDPLSGKDYGETRESYFRSKVKSHLIFYKINNKKKQVEIIRILHQQMDIDSGLDD